MKFGSLIVCCALAVASFGLESKNVCGLMNVPSDAAVTMIAVPWVNVGADGKDVEVARLVKTDTLAAGDELYYYNGKDYYRWVLTEGKWEPSGVTNKDGTFVAPGDGYTIPRGKGLFIVRNGESKGEIWLYGQNSTASAQVTIMAPDAGAKVAYNMIANPNTTDYDLNAKGIEGAEGDTIILSGGAITYNYSDKNWWKMVRRQETVGGKVIWVQEPSSDGVVIPAGQGAWYCSAGGKPTIVW